MKQNKKAIIFSISLVLITLGALVGLLLIVTNIEKQIDPIRTIGERAIELAAADSEAQKLQFYIEESAKIAAEKAVKQFEQSAGLLNSLECGLVNQDQAYIYWNSAQNPNKKCFETDFLQNYAVYFNSQLNSYLNLQAGDKNKAPENNYDLFVQDEKELSGIALKPIKFTIFSPSESIQINDKILWHYEDIATTATAKYAFKPSFTIPFKYGFSELKQIKELARTVINCKENTEQKEKEACIKNIVSKITIKIKFEQLDENTFIFETLEQFPLKFALFIPTKALEQK